MLSSVEVQTPNRLPLWFRKKLAHGHQAEETDQRIKELGLNTICRSGKCPNRNECYSQKTASFMILGDRCTRNCHYCSVAPGKPLPPDPKEPHNLAQAVRWMGLEHVVITSVTRDDLPDEGVQHFKEVIQTLRSEIPSIIIEILTPDFRRNQTAAIEVISTLDFDIFNHNIETVRAQHARVRPQGGYDLSLALIKKMKEAKPSIITKSGAMLGLGETKDQIQEMLSDLRSADCQMLTLGQYLRPEPQATPVVRYASPEEFEEWKSVAYSLGFDLVESAPFVRSSYHAADSFTKLKTLLASSSV